MVIENVISYLEKDINYFYTDIVDVTVMTQDIIFFAHAPEDILKHEYIRVSKVDAEILIELHTNDSELIEEAVLYSKQIRSDSIYFLLNEYVDLPGLQKKYRLEYLPEHPLKDYGVYGYIESVECPSNADNFEVNQPDSEDVLNITKLENIEWAFLPQRIRYMDKTNILIAKSAEGLLGYLVFDSAVSGYADLCIVYVHKKHRQKGIGTLLLSAFANESKARNMIPYYGCATSFASSMLAKRMNICQVRKPIDVYRLS